MKVGFILTSDGIGGTEKRIVNLFNYLSDNSINQYYLIISDNLYEIMKDKLQNVNNVIIVFSRFPNNLTRFQGKRIFGFRLRGITKMLTPLLRFEIKTTLRRHNYINVLHYTMALNYLYPAQKNFAVLLEAQSVNFRNIFKNKLHIEGLKSGAVFNCASERIRNEYRKISDRMYNGNNSPKLHVNPCSFVDYTKTYIATKNMEISFLGRMEKLKNPELFVESIYILSKKRRDFKVYMMGKGTLDNIIDKKIKDLGLNDIIVHEHNANPEKILARSIAYVSLQSFDNYHSQALMEAMACGCSIIGSNVGETYKLVDETVGHLVNLDAEEIASKIDYVLDNFEQSKVHGQNARKKVMNEQNIKIYTEYLEKLYAEIFPN